MARSFYSVAIVISSCLATPGISQQAQPLVLDQVADHPLSAKSSLRSLPEQISAYVIENRFTLACGAFIALIVGKIGLFQREMEMGGPLDAFSPPSVPMNQQTPLDAVESCVSDALPGSAVQASEVQGSETADNGYEGDIESKSTRQRRRPARPFDRSQLAAFSPVAIQASSFSSQFSSHAQPFLPGGSGSCGMRAFGPMPCVTSLSRLREAPQVQRSFAQQRRRQRPIHQNVERREREAGKSLEDVSQNGLSDKAAAPASRAEEQPAPRSAARRKRTRFKPPPRRPSEERQALAAAVRKVVLETLQDT